MIKPLYSVPETGNYWFITYHNHYIKELGMNSLIYNLCLLWSNTPNYFGIVGFQTDDTLFLANTTFADTEQQHLEKAYFLAKECEQLIVKQSLKFNRYIIQFS